MDGQCVARRLVERFAPITAYDQRVKRRQLHQLIDSVSDYVIDAVCESLVDEISDYNAVVFLRKVLIKYRT